MDTPCTLFDLSPFLLQKLWILFLRTWTSSFPNRTSTRTCKQWGLFKLGTWWSVGGDGGHKYQNNCKGGYFVNAVFWSHDLWPCSTSVAASLLISSQIVSTTTTPSTFNADNLVKLEFDTIRVSGVITFTYHICIAMQLIMYPCVIRPLSILSPHSNATYSFYVISTAMKPTIKPPEHLSIKIAWLCPYSAYIIDDDHDLRIRVETTSLIRIRYCGPELVQFSLYKTLVQLPELISSIL